MSDGLGIRLNRLRNEHSGKILAVAFDHGGSGVPDNGSNVMAIAASIIRSGIDAALLGAGISEHSAAVLAEPGSPALIVSIDAPVFSSVPGVGGHVLRAHRRIVSIKRAIAAGADAVKVLLPVGQETAQQYGDSLQIAADAIGEAHEFAIPVMVEAVGWGPEAKDSSGLLPHLARISVELGADLVKLPAPTDTATLERIVADSPVPIVMVGGNPRSDSDFVESIMQWMQAGAAGVAVGRNIWSRSDPAAAAKALSVMVHEGDRQAALKLLADGDGRQ